MPTEEFEVMAGLFETTQTAERRHQEHKLIHSEQATRIVKLEQEFAVIQRDLEHIQTTLETLVAATKPKPTNWLSIIAICLTVGGQAVALAFMLGRFPTPGDFADMRASIARAEILNAMQQATIDTVKEELRELRGRRGP